MYTCAKRWNYVRVTGIVVIALAAPVISVLIPRSATILGAIAGAWIFLARTFFLSRERRWVRPAAGVQDAFDSYVYGLPANIAVAPEPERTADIIGDDDVLKHARKERLLGWYSLNPALPGTPAIAISQHTNLAYSRRLLSRHAEIGLGVGIAWGLIAVVIGISFHLSLAEFLLGVVMPVLPAVLDARELWDSARLAADDRSRLSEALAARIRAWPSHAIKLEDLRSWQDQIYRLRRDGPLVPDFLYRRTRSDNERAMSALAEDFASTVLRNVGENSH
jgi:hypothetical protein